MNDLITYTTNDGDELQLSTHILRTEVLSAELAAKATEQELNFYLARCRFLGLNPYLGEIHFVKYGNNPATYIIAAEVLIKRLNDFPDYDGKQAGVTVLNTATGQIERREGSLVLPGEKLIGGWAKVFRKGKSKPDYAEVSMDEYNQKQAQWNLRPATMIRKVALAHAIKEAFPKEYEGVYIEEEIDRRDNAVMGASGPATERDERVVISDSQLKALVDEAVKNPKEADAVIRGAGFISPKHVTTDKYDELMEALKALSAPKKEVKPVAEVEPEPVAVPTPTVTEPDHTPSSGDRSNNPYADHAPYRGAHAFAGKTLKEIPVSFLQKEATKVLDPDNKYYSRNLELQNIIREHLAGPVGDAYEGDIPFDLDSMR